LYNSLQLAKKYLQYYFTAGNGKGHGIHSPFVFDFITHVLNDKKEQECYAAIEALRQSLLQNTNAIDVEDFGAGSAVIHTNRRVIGKIAASSLKLKKYAQLLYRIARYYKPETIIELGTSFGITTSYLASASEDARVITCEGAKNIAAVAQENFASLKLKNVQLITGDFEKTLPSLLASIKKIDMAFVDGHHKKEPTIDYYKMLLKLSHAKTILIFDDIHWSREMEEAWNHIRQDAAVTLSIDLFFIGLIFIDPGFKEKQHFKIRF
jgi:predicted O-methyltransferase YrrM